MKILCTGDQTYGLCKALAETKLDIEFICEKDYLFNQTDFIRSVEQKSLDAEIFINCAKLSGFLQTKLLYNIYYLWSQMEKKGLIISVGSDIIHHPKPTMYCLEKQTLKSLHDMLYNKNEDIKLSLIHPGKLGDGHLPYSDIAIAITNVMITQNVREITIA